MTANPRPKIRREELKPGEVLCDYCTARCCRYYALPLETPDTREEMDYLRWYLLHGETGIFTENETWYLLVHTVCKHLQSDNRCGIYHTRPQICRDYSTENCEYDDSHVYDRYFETSEQVEEYMDAVFSEPERFRTPRPSLFPIIT
jgi:Fe-S-cluster containining protein